jgi:acylphosphatase
MKRLTAYVSGRVQKTGYRARVIDLARAFGLKGTIQNLDDGRVKIIAEGDESFLQPFVKAVKINDSLINVVTISEEYSDATDDFEKFYKSVESGETDERLDRSAELLSELIIVVKEGFSGVNGKLDILIQKQDQMLSKQDQMLSKQDQMLGKQDQMLDKQDDLLEEVKGARSDLKSYMATRFEQIECEISDLKSALREKGII